MTLSQAIKRISSTSSQHVSEKASMSAHGFQGLYAMPSINDSAQGTKPINPWMLPGENYQRSQLQTSIIPSSATSNVGQRNAAQFQNSIHQESSNSLYPPTTSRGDWQGTNCSAHQTASQGQVSVSDKPTSKLSSELEFRGGHSDDGFRQASLVLMCNDKIVIHCQQRDALATLELVTKTSSTFRLKRQEAVHCPFLVDVSLLVSCQVGSSDWGSAMYI